MRFYSKATAARIQISNGGMQADPLVPNLFHSVTGKMAQFKGGFFETQDPAEIMALKNHMSYGYGKEFWSEEDRPETERTVDELARLKAELAALKAATGKQVITVDRPAPAPAPTVTKDEGDKGLARLNRLKQEAVAKGIPVERGSSADDLEKALAAI